MPRFKNFALLFATLWIFWLILNNSLASDVMLIGALAAFVISLFFPRGLAVVSEFRATPKSFVTAVRYLFYFLAALVKSNLQLARIVLSPDLPVRPGIVKVRTRLKSAMGRMLLANSITLTPGTLTVEMAGEWLYVHWVSVESTDIEAATESIVAGFERHIEVMYG